jgi:hypothetical protein
MMLLTGVVFEDSDKSVLMATGVCVCVHASTGRGNRTHAKTNAHVGLQNSNTVSEEFVQVGLGFSSHQVDFAPKQPKKKHPLFCVCYERFHSMERVGRQFFCH